MKLIRKVQPRVSLQSRWAEMEGGEFLFICCDKVFAASRYFTGKPLAYLAYQGSKKTQERGDDEPQRKTKPNFHSLFLTEAEGGDEEWSASTRTRAAASRCETPAPLEH